MPAAVGLATLLVMSARRTAPTEGTLMPVRSSMRMPCSVDSLALQVAGDRGAGGSRHRPWLEV